MIACTNFSSVGSSYLILRMCKRADLCWVAWPILFQLKAFSCAVNLRMKLDFILCVTVATKVLWFAVLVLSLYILRLLFPTLWWSRFLFFYRLFLINFGTICLVWRSNPFCRLIVLIEHQCFQNLWAHLRLVLQEPIRTERVPSQLCVIMCFVACV